MPPSPTIITIGTLPANPLWNERQPRRTGHATTTLIRDGKRTILIDPGLPDRAVTARLEERTGLTPAEITHVFLTSFKTDTCRGIRAFDHATWWIAERDRSRPHPELRQRLRPPPELPAGA